MTLLFKLITKIKNQVIMSILLIFFSVIMLFCSAGFFILPFIIYGETSRVTFLIAWGICSIEVFIEMLLASKRKMEIDKKEKEKYQKDKVVYWFSVVSSILAIIFVFLLVFLKRNFKLSVNIFDICFFFISFLIITACASNLLSMYKNKYKQMARDAVITFLCLFSTICVAVGIKAYEENNLASKILIAFGTIVLLIVCIKHVFNFLLSIERMNTVSSSILFFIGIGVLGAILLRYVVTDCKLQEILTTIFAAVVGGTITLGGVAWTIKKSDNDRKIEEKQKAKPIFTFVMKLRPLINIDGGKVCFDNEETIKFPNNVTALLENSEQAVFSVERVYHDNKWWEIQGNKVVLPNSSVYLDFNFTEDVNKLFIEIKDRLGNLYYYQIKVLMLNLLTKHKGEMGNRVAHTIRELIEVSKEEIEELI